MTIVSEGGKGEGGSGDDSLHLSGGVLVDLSPFMRIPLTKFDERLSSKQNPNPKPLKPHRHGNKLSSLSAVYSLTRSRKCFLCLCRYDAHEDRVWAMGLRADEQQLVSGSADGVICLWCVLWHCSVMWRMFCGVCMAGRSDEKQFHANLY